MIMKNLRFALLSIIAIGGICSAFCFVDNAPAATNAGELKWYTWEEAVELNKTKPKKIFVDVYTDWCGWCKRMDKATFNDPSVAAYLTANFYPVKLNAEQKADIKFNGETFKYVDNGGRGIHTLAYSLLDGKLGYPTVVYLNEKYERIMISPGYKEPADMIKELKFAAEEHYNKTTWEQYRENN
jgi:thioredoxin-related protein